MKYMVNQISNRDTQLLHEYRILRQPSDYLSPIFRDDVQSTQILSGTESDLLFDGDPLFEFDLGLNIPDDKIPYLEFETKTKSDFRNLQSLVFLDGNRLFGFVGSFEQSVDISLYLVDSLYVIEQTINRYLDDLTQLKAALGSLRDRLKNKLNSRESFIIAGRDQNLIQFCRDGEELAMEDSHYKLVTTLVGQTLLNPPQAVLALIPKILSHDLLIQITDGKRRILQGFSGFTVFVTGNGDWVFRDTKSTVNIATTTSKIEINAFNCSLLYLRSNSEIGTQLSKIEVGKLFLHRTNCLINDGIVDELRAVGQSTAVAVGGSIKQIEYVGPGSWVDCMLRNANFKSENILGTVYAHGMSNDTSGSGIIFGDGVPTLSYLSGHRIGFLQGQTDFELLPSRVSSIDVDNVHIHDKSDTPVTLTSDEPAMPDDSSNSDEP